MPNGGSGEARVEYAAMLLGATGNVGGHILHLLVQSPLCKKVVVVTRRNVAALANPKVQQVVVNMDRLEEELAPHANGVDIAIAAFGVGKGSAKMADEEVRRIEIAYPMAFASAAKKGGARVLAMMTAAGADSRSSSKYLRNMGDKEKKSEELRFDFLGLYRPGVILGNSNTPSALGVVMPLFDWALPSRCHSIHKNDLARHGRAVGAGVARPRAGQGPRGADGEDSRVQGDGTVLRDGRQRRGYRSEAQRIALRNSVDCSHRHPRARARRAEAIGR